MISTMIRTSATKAAPRRFISNSTRNNAAVSLGHQAMASPATASASSKTKVAAYTVLGSTAVVAGVSLLLKDEVVYWTPNVRK
ncbi:hypothetical protein EC968_010434 [Mortierella alpina]|nr:hypothetical protein EC968_010434 [Mortierella alpina]